MSLYPTVRAATRNVEKRDQSLFTALRWVNTQNPMDRESKRRSMSCVKGESRAKNSALNDALRSSL